MSVTIHPIEVLEGLFYFYPGNNFTNDREIIHTAFYELRRRHWDMFGDITFRTNVLFPRSRVLDDLLSSMQPGFLGKVNPTYDQYEIKRENLKKLWESELKSKFGNKADELEAYAKELKDLMAV